jgi:hypothetical protein
MNINLSANIGDVASEIADRPEYLAEMIQEIAEYLGFKIGETADDHLEEVAQNLDDAGRALVLAMAAQIKKSGAES